MKKRHLKHLARQRKQLHHRLKSMHHMLQVSHRDYLAGHLSHDAYREIRIINEPILAHFINRLRHIDRISKQAKPAGGGAKATGESAGAQASDEKPIGETIEAKQAQEKAEFKEDYAKTGTLNLSQASEKSALSKIGGLFKKKENAASVAPTLESSAPAAPAKDSGAVPAELQMAMDKLQAELFALKDKNQFFADRIQQINETVGELRSLYFQKDKVIGEIQAQAEKANEITSIIDPQRINKLLEQRKREIEELWDKFESAQEIAKRAQDEITQVRGALGQITSVKNIVDEAGKLSKLTSEVKNLKEITRQYAERAEGAFMEIQDKVSDISALRAKIDMTDELGKDNTKRLDRMNLTLENLPTKEDINQLRGTVNKLLQDEEVLGELKQKVDKIIEQVNEIVIIKSPEKASVELKNKESAIDEFEQQKRQINFLLQDLNEDFENRRITQSAYAEARRMNEALLNEIDQKISVLQMAKEKETTRLRKMEEKKAAEETKEESAGAQARDEKSEEAEEEETGPELSMEDTAEPAEKPEEKPATKEDAPAEAPQEPAKEPAPAKEAPKEKAAPLKKEEPAKKSAALLLEQSKRDRLDVDTVKKKVAPAPEPAPAAKNSDGGGAQAAGAVDRGAGPSEDDELDGLDDGGAGAGGAESIDLDKLLKDVTGDELRGAEKGKRATLGEPAAEAAPAEKPAEPKPATEPVKESTEPAKEPAPAEAPKEPAADPAKEEGKSEDDLGLDDLDLDDSEEGEKGKEPVKEEPATEHEELPVSGSDKKATVFQENGNDAPAKPADETPGGGAKATGGERGGTARDAEDVANAPIDKLRRMHDKYQQILEELTNQYNDGILTDKEFYNAQTRAMEQLSKINAQMIAKMEDAK